MVVHTSHFAGDILVLRESTGELLRKIPTSGPMTGNPLIKGNYLIYPAGLGSMLDPRIVCIEACWCSRYLSARDKCDTTSVVSCGGAAIICCVIHF